MTIQQQQQQQAPIDARARIKQALREMNIASRSEREQNASVIERSQSDSERDNLLENSIADNRSKSVSVPDIER